MKLRFDVPIPVPELKESAELDKIIGEGSRNWNKLDNEISKTCHIMIYLSHLDGLEFRPDLIYRFRG